MPIEMNRQFMKDMILATISDDYESLEDITRQLRRYSQASMTRVSDVLVVDVLAELVEENLAPTYILSPNPPHARPVPFSRDSLVDLWFYITPLGKTVVQSLHKLGTD